MNREEQLEFIIGQLTESMKCDPYNSYASIACMQYQNELAALKRLRNNRIAATAGDEDIFGEEIGDTGQRMLYAVLKSMGTLPPVAGYNRRGEAFYRISSLSGAMA